MKININTKWNIPFMTSIVVFLVSVWSLLTFGLKAGIDFTGGSLLELSYNTSRPSVAQMTEILKPLNLGNVVIQPEGDKEVLLRFKLVDEDTHQKILTTVRSAAVVKVVQPKTTVTSTAAGIDASLVLENRFQTIGPSISATLRTKAVWTALTIIAAIIIYIAWAFRKVSRPVESWKYGVSAVLALCHDVTISSGIFALLGHYAGVEVDISFVVAMLTVFGYSVNDTIVVFDRVRENLIRRGSGDFGVTVNNAVNETIARSINTTFVTLLPLIALFFYGGATIHYFALALLVGITLGAYSSIFVASPLLIIWGNRANRK